MRATFDLDGIIVIIADGKHLDLHNCFDFVGYEHRPTERFMRLRWNRGTDEWVSPALPKGLILTFLQVKNVAVRPRDDAMPFTEDNCVASISFLPAALNDEFGAVCFGERFPDEHLSLRFQSGAGIKIWAESVSHEFLFE